MKNKITGFLAKDFRITAENFDQAVPVLAPRPVPPPHHAMRVHKRPGDGRLPRLSIILLDWDCRERFDPLDWLNQQNVPREDYELIWVELFDRVVPEVMEKADIVVTCHQDKASGIYDKHAGYNAGLLLSRGELVCVCDSDAVFPTDFVQSIFKFFYSNGPAARPGVYFHYEGRSSLEYPGLKSADELRSPSWHWWGLHPNVGACMTVRTADAYRYGGFDAHESYKGYLCGPYDLGWRLMNAGMPEVWHDFSTMLWHFAHPDPVGSNGLFNSLKQNREITYPHVNLHALHAVEALTCGRLEPLTEDQHVRSRRLVGRSFGTEYTARYGFEGPARGFSRRALRTLKRGMLVDQFRVIGGRLAQAGLSYLLGRLSPRILADAKARRQETGTAHLIYSHLGNCIYRRKETLLAVPHWLKPAADGSFDLALWPHCRTGTSFRALLDQIDDMPPGVCKQPDLAREDVSGTGYNAIAFLGMVIAQHRSEGPFELGRLLQPDFSHPIAVARTLRQVDRALTSGEGLLSDPVEIRKTFFAIVEDLLAVERLARHSDPIFIASGPGVNLIHFDCAIYLVPHAAGRVDFFKDEDLAKPGIVRCPDIDSLQKVLAPRLPVLSPKTAAKATAEPPAQTAASQEAGQGKPAKGEAVQPLTAVSAHGYYIVHCNGSYYGIPQKVEGDSPRILVSHDQALVTATLAARAAAEGWTAQATVPPLRFRGIGDCHLLECDGIYYAILPEMPETPSQVMATRDQDLLHRMVAERMGATRIAAKPEVPTAAHGPQHGPQAASVPSPDRWQPGPDDQPQLLAEHKDHNIVSYGPFFWGIPRWIGEVRLEFPADRQKPELLCSMSMKETRNLIDRRMDPVPVRKREPEAVS